MARGRILARWGGVGRGVGYGRGRSVGGGFWQGRKECLAGVDQSHPLSSHCLLVLSVAKESKKTGQSMAHRARHARYTTSHMVLLRRLTHTLFSHSCFPGDSCSAVFAPSCVD